MKKYHFDTFRHEKHFKKQPQPHSQNYFFVNKPGKLITSDMSKNSNYLMAGLV